MITLNSDWTYTAGDGDCEIGYSGENEVHALLIRQDGLTYADWDFLWMSSGWMEQTFGRWKRRCGRTD